MGEGAAANFSLNERIDGLGRWLIWFRAIYSRHERYYSDDLRSQSGLGDVIVGWRRGTVNTNLWVPGVTMLILGGAPPRAPDWSAAGVAERAGDEHPLWMSYIHAHGWAVVAEGSRGILRPNGVLVRWSAELAETLRQQLGEWEIRYTSVMILANKWLRIFGTALVAGVAFLWIGRGFRLGIEPWQVAVVAGAGALGAWYRIRKGRDE